MKLWELIIAFLQISISQGTINTQSSVCKFIPADEGWPRNALWDSFNDTVSGRLIKSVPVGSVCHDPTYDEAQCLDIQGKWRVVEMSLDDPASIQHTIYLNKTCDPFTDRSTPCKLGAYPVYAVNVTSPTDVISTVNFAKENDIRLVVKNTGHELSDVGSGALSIWTHAHQEQEWFDVYEDPWSHYKGPAVKVHAGVLGEQIFHEAHARGYAVVTGECPTVGFAGGYVQGGGHSLLSTYLGMAADQVLSFEVITTTGQFINVSTTEHSDLFWALRGGGGGAFAVVWTATIKAFSDFPLAVGNFSVSQADNGEDIYWKAIEGWERHGRRILDAHGWAYTITTPSNTFTAPAIVLPNGSLEDLETVIAPLFEAFDSIGLKYTKTLGSYPNYLEGLNAIPALKVFSVNDFHMSSRLVSGSNFDTEEGVENYVNIFKKLVALGLHIDDIVVAPGRSVRGIPENAVFPGWRTAERFVMPRKPWQNTDTVEKLYADVEEIKTVAEPIYKRLGDGTYLNENNPFNPNWKHDFYGVNYDRLLEIKDKYDPDQLLYGSISVGGDRWVQQEDGRLCKAGSDVVQKVNERFSTSEGMF